MASGGSASAGINESTATVSDYCSALESERSVENKLGMPLNSAIYELLECPICMHLMYPPIQQVFNCFGYQFCLHFEAFPLGTSPVYIAFLRFMGSEEDAQKFSYSLQVGGNGKKLTWEGVPRSIRDSHRKVRDSLDGLIIQRNLALILSSGADRQEGEELKLKLTGRIWRNDRS